MVKLGSPFVKYNSNNGTITNVKTGESTPTKTKPLFPFITSGNSIRDYLKRKIFKATKEEVASLLKSTSNLNLAGKFSSKSSSSQNSKVPTSKKCNKVKSSTVQYSTRDFEPNQLITNAAGQNEQQIEEEPIEQTEVTLITEGPAIIDVESSTEIEKPVVEIKVASCRRFSLIRISKRKKTRFAEDLTQSLPASSDSSPPPLDHKRQPRIVKWAKKVKRNKVKPDDRLGEKVPTGKSGDVEEEEKKVPVKWTKRVRKFAIRTCRYLGYGAQMISPLTPYADMSMPVGSCDGFYNVYPPYYGSDPYYSYSSCGNIYGYGHYGLNY